jgi:hypothetical protein
VVAAATNQQQQRPNTDVVVYLIKNGYLESLDFTKNSLRKAIRQSQRENDLTINGRITPEYIEFAKNENGKNRVVIYLKTYNYIIGSVNPTKIEEAVKTLQRNSGVLKVTGTIDKETIDFIDNTRPRAYSEGLLVPP